MDGVVVEDPYKIDFNLFFRHPKSRATGVTNRLAYSPTNEKNDNKSKYL